MVSDPVGSIGANLHDRSSARIFNIRCSITIQRDVRCGILHLGTPFCGARFEILFTVCCFCSWSIPFGVRIDAVPLRSGSRGREPIPRRGQSFLNTTDRTDFGREGRRGPGCLPMIALDAMASRDCEPTIARSHELCSRIGGQRT
jgi:hypothetical protein